LDSPIAKAPWYQERLAAIQRAEAPPAANSEKPSLPQKRMDDTECS
jgi:hypothetical protein